MQQALFCEQFDIPHEIEIAPPETLTAETRDIVIESIEQLAAIEQAAREARPRLEAARKHIDAMITSIEEQRAAARAEENDRALNPSGRYQRSWSAVANASTALVCSE